MGALLIGLIVTLGLTDSSFVSEPASFLAILSASLSCALSSFS